MNCSAPDPPCAENMCSPKVHVMSFGVDVSSTRCKARTKAGDFCKARATPDGFCSIHSDPERAAELGRRSGECRRLPQSAALALLPPKTAGDLHNALGQIFSKVSAGEVDVKVGRSLAYIASVLVKTTEVWDHEIRLRAREQMMKSIESMEDKR